jgi:hypothetical protein
MKNKIFIIALILSSLFCNPLIVPAQQQQQQQQQPENRGSSVRFNESGILVEFKTETDPPQSGNKFEVRGTTHIKGEQNITHRIFVDQTTGATFGYDLEVQPSSVANHFMLTIKPLSVEKLNIKPLAVKSAPVTPLPVEQMPVETKDRIVRKAATKVEGNQNPNIASGANAATVVTDKNKPGDGVVPVGGSSFTKYPPAFLIEDGGMFALDVLVNQQTGVKIIDVIRVSSAAKQVSEKVVKLQSPRDFSPDAAELSVKNFRFLINEQPVVGAENPVRGGVSGAIIWIFLPGKGRFIFSLMPREGFDFQKIGAIQDNKISFQIAGERYEWISSAPVFGGECFGGGGSWNLWVLHDADYSPKNELFTAGGYQIGAADRIEYLLKKK